MATKRFSVLDYSHAPEARPFAGRSVSLTFFAEKDEVRISMTRQHAEALRASLDEAIAKLDQIAASVGVGPALLDDVLVLPVEGPDGCDGGRDGES